MTSTFHYLAFRTSAQATEDEAKVKQALLFAVGTAAEVTESFLEGQHKNPIRLMEVELKARAAIDRFFQRLVADQPDAVETLRRQLDQRLDEELTFYMRLSKQDAFLGRLALGSGEDSIQVRAKVAAFPARMPVARATLDAYLAALDGSRPRI